MDLAVMKKLNSKLKSLNFPGIQINAIAYMLCGN